MPVATSRQVRQVAANHVRDDIGDRPAGADRGLLPLGSCQPVEQRNEGGPVGREQLGGEDWLGRRERYAQSSHGFEAANSSSVIARALSSGRTAAVKGSSWTAWYTLSRHCSSA